MKVLGICGSPRRGGNTEILLEKALEGARAAGVETEKIILSELNITPCREEEYENINDEGLSIVEDDMRFIFQKIKESEVLILASPVFFGSLSAQMKIMIDRFQCVWVAKTTLKKEVFIKKRTGGFICAGGEAREDFFENSVSIIRHFFAVINVTYRGGIFCAGIDKKGDVSGHPDLLKNAFELGKRFADGEENIEKDGEKIKKGINSDNG